MAKTLFTRAEFTDLTGIRHQTTYQLEKKNIIKPGNNGYSFNQIVFGRFLEQSRRAFGVTSIKFADGFGGRAQYEIEWEKVELIFLTEQGAGIIQEDDLPDGLNDVVDEWLLPIEREAFPVDGSDIRVKRFFVEHFRFIPKDGSHLVISVLGRIRQRILEEIEVRGLESKLEKAKTIKQNQSSIPIKLLA